MKWILQRNVWVLEGELVTSLALKPSDEFTDDFSWLNIYQSWETGGVFYNYTHNTHHYCPLNNFYIDNCPHLKDNIPCSHCPDAQYFLILDGKIVPVRKVPCYGDI